jgi:hypothetical protein
MPRALPVDLQAVEVEALAVETASVADELARYDARENAAHRALLAQADNDYERRVLTALIEGDEHMERPRITRVRFALGAIFKQAHRLAGVLTGVAR